MGTRRADPRRRPRTCLGCRKVTDRDQLVRIGRSADGALALGPGPGRGAWVCSVECLDEAARRRRLARALRSELTDHELEIVRATMIA